MTCVEASERMLEKEYGEMHDRAEEMIRTCMQSSGECYARRYQSAGSLAGQGLVECQHQKTSAGGGCQGPWPANVFEGMPALLGGSSYNTWT
jgi:hypothetical protein